MDDKDRCKFDAERYHKSNCCLILTEKNCSGCKFRKTEEEFREAQQRSKERLMQINREQFERLKQFF